ncbi:hypothetical protein AMTRI_Chr01g135890 [Amborella trichopoda]
MASPPLPLPSSSDFEFTVSLSPTSPITSRFCPADELFFKGQLLPLHLPPRLLMLHSLSLSTSPPNQATSNSSDTDSNSLWSKSSDSSSSRHSNGSSQDSLSSPRHSTSLSLSARSSNATEEDGRAARLSLSLSSLKKLKTRFSSVFRAKPEKPTKPKSPIDVIQRYLRKVKPLCERISQKQRVRERSEKEERDSGFESCRRYSISFSGNLGYSEMGRRRRRASGLSYSFGSCPSSMRSSPTHSGLLGRSSCPVSHSSLDSSMEELQSAIQGAINHCKRTQEVKI